MYGRHFYKRWHFKKKKKIKYTNSNKVLLVLFVTKVNNHIINIHIGKAAKTMTSAYSYDVFWGKYFLQKLRDFMQIVPNSNF